MFDVTEIGFATFVERRRHADNDGVNILKALEIGSGVEMAAVDELLNFILTDVLDIGLARIEHGDFGRVGIKTGDFMAGFGKAQGQGQTHVTAADDSNF